MKKQTFQRTKTLINLTLVAFSVVLSSQQSIAQTEEPVKEKEVKEKEKKDSGKIDASDKSTAAIKYRRSSLHTMIMEDDKLPKKDIILNTFLNAEFPDKYNDHTIGEKSFNVSKYLVLADTNSKKITEEDYIPAINKYFEEAKVANKIVAKWFNRKENGAFDMNLIQERGMYDASAQDVQIASSSSRGDAALADAGEELLPNTFVVVSYSKFVSNEVAALAAKTTAIATAQAIKVAALKEVAIKAAEAAYEKARHGYSVWTTAYLYELNWNDSTSAVFYQNYWMDDNSVDPAKKEAFDNSNLFKMNLIGYQKTSALISGLGKNADSEVNIIKNATLKSIDAVYAKLQRKFEKFRTKTPLVSADPLAAKIGMKEGLEKGDKYEVLEQNVGADGKVIYKRKGVITVEKDKIMDNRYRKGQEPLDEEGNPIKPENDFEYTTFKGGKGYYAGMLIRQIN